MEKNCFKGCFCSKEKKIRRSHYRGFLSAVSTTFKGKRGGDPRLRPSGMTPLFNHGGFTLIELLVVVLIIAVLAAVALPQYNKAIKKAQGAEVLAAYDALDKALHAYYLEHGTFENVTVEKLGVSIPDLKYWLYMPYGLAPLSEGTSNLQIWRVDSEKRIMVKVTSKKDTNISVYKNWYDNGRKTEASCFNSSPASKQSCMDYFNCEGEPLVHHQVGTDYWSGGSCSKLK